MADEKKPTKDVQLLADVAMVEGTAYHRGDTITIPAEQADNLAGFTPPAVGPVGGLEKQAKAKSEAERILAEGNRPDTGRPKG